jgi:hypothetical protein
MPNNFHESIRYIAFKFITIINRFLKLTITDNNKSVPKLTICGILFQKRVDPCFPYPTIFRKPISRMDVFPKILTSIIIIPPKTFGKTPIREIGFTVTP